MQQVNRNNVGPGIQNSRQTTIKDDKQLINKEMSFEQTTNQLKTTINNKQDTVCYKHNRILPYNTVLGTK